MDDIAVRAERAGEISSGRQAEMLEFVPAVAFAVDEKRFAQNMRSSRRGAAPAPLGMTSEYLRPLLARPADLHWLFRAGEQMVEAICMGRMTARQKTDGGVRRIAAGDVMRRLVGRTVAQQMMPAVEGFTPPFQYALRTRAGTECVAHMFQAVDGSQPKRICALHRRSQRIRHGVKAGDVGSIVQSPWGRSDLAIRSFVLWQPIAVPLGGRCGRGAPHFARRRGREG